MSPRGCALRATPVAAPSTPLCRQRRRIRESRLSDPSIALRRAAAGDADAAATTSSCSAPSTTTISSSSASSTTTTTTTRPVLIVFDLDNASIPSRAASAVVSVLAREMRSLLSRDEDEGVDLSVRAEAFANEATLKSRGDLAPSLREAGIPLSTAPSSIRNAADAMVVSCATRAIPSLSSGRGGLVLVGNDTGAYANFLRFASSKGVRTLVAGDFDHGRRGGGRRRWEGGSGSGSDDVEVDGYDPTTAATPPWRRKELPAAADHAVLWCDVLSEARELMLVR